MIRDDEGRACLHLNLAGKPPRPFEEGLQDKQKNKHPPNPKVLNLIVSISFHYPNIPPNMPRLMQMALSFSLLGIEFVSRQMESGLPCHFTESP